MTRPKARRDFLIDSGALSFLAASDQRSKAWLDEIASRYDDPAIYVTGNVLTEARSGKPDVDANINRLPKRLAGATSPNPYYLDVPERIADRAALLRIQGTTARGSSARRRPISVTDAQLVALAEDRSSTNAVTILTTDPDDIMLLVDLTGATNIAVQAV